LLPLGQAIFALFTFQNGNKQEKTASLGNFGNFHLLFIFSGK